MKDYLRLMRVKHYIKNLIIFLPLIFSGQFCKINLLFQTILGCIVFSLASSIVYIFNDINDVEIDIRTKKRRPLAEGVISVKQAWRVIVCLGSFIILISYVTNVKMGTADTSLLIVMFYILINILYSLGMKNFPIVDVIILAFGYILRVIYGGVLIGTGVSDWMFLTILSIAIYFGIGKRRQELITLGCNGRKVLEQYSESFLTRNMQMFLCAAVIFYSLYSSEKVITYDNFEVSMILTVPIILVICLRYDFLLDKNEGMGDPVEIILKDRVLKIMIVLYGTLTMVLLNFGAIL